MDEQETHPLDKDYSAPSPPSPTQPKPAHIKLRRVGFGIIALGFATLIPAGILLGDPRTVGPNEPLGNQLHRLAMVLILIGGISVVVSYRMPAIQQKAEKSGASVQWNQMLTFMLLVILNLMTFGGIYLLYDLLRAYLTRPAQSYLAINGAITILCALMVTLAFWHKGMLRAYSIGVIVALVFNAMMSSSIFINMMYGGGYGRRDSATMMLGSVAIIQISGLVCAAYVGILQWLSPDRKETGASMRGSR